MAPTVGFRLGFANRAVVECGNRTGKALLKISRDTCPESHERAHVVESQFFKTIEILPRTSLTSVEV